MTHNQLKGGLSKGQHPKLIQQQKQPENFIKFLFFPSFCLCFIVCFIVVCFYCLYVMGVIRGSVKRGS